MDRDTQAGLSARVHGPHACLGQPNTSALSGLARTTSNLHQPVGPFDGPWTIPAAPSLLSYAYLLHSDSVWTDLDFIGFYFSS